ncbi:neural Wiskott-Aldrich syndrome protein isoform X2 [Sphaeramia orbicularis]|uniref:neural Wiskott-Aldrich syndrome protein isoform X2 n=1 Tax=Sphaeramia orbicularis TaxID=375764 RepID=UPI00117D0AD5|nr:neural Wiskott-Aldrich syndrome protein-like isoform X2 [Sphaeramia orbicularis]
MASGLIPGLQVMSDLLTIREKGVLLSLLGPQCQLIKSTVAQVLVATETQGRGLGWTSLGCGVVCVIEDHSVHSYFLRLYCVKRAELLWEQEVYIPFKYTATHTYFHTFPADNQQAGFNFANETEAEEFHFAVESVQKHQASLLLTVNAENEEDKEDGETAAPYDSGMKPLDDSDSQTHYPTDLSPTVAASGSFKDLDPAMRRLLMQVKLTEDDLKNKNVSEAVNSIINQFGGLKAVQRELNRKGSASKTLPRASMASISLMQGALSHSTTSSQLMPQSRDTLDFCQFAFTPPPASMAPPPFPQKIKKTMNSASDLENSDLLLSALRDAIKRKQHQHK